MNERTWSSTIADTESPAPGTLQSDSLDALKYYFHEIDEGKLRQPDVTPAELLKLGKLAKNGLEEPMVNMIDGLTHSLAIAEAEQPEAVSAPKEYGWSLLSADEVQQLSQYHRGGSLHGEESEPTYKDSLQKGYAEHKTSPLADALQGWSSTIGSPLVDKDVIVFDLSDVAGEATLPVGHSYTALPIIQGSPDKTLQLAGAVRDAIAKLDSLANNAHVQQFLDEYEQSPVDIARKTQDTHLPVRSAPLRMYAEAIMTSAELVALALADADPNIDVALAVCTLARTNAFEKAALGLPMGVVGPLAIRGKVPEGGLVHDEGSKLKVDEGFAEAIKHETAAKNQSVDRLMGIGTAFRETYPEAIVEGTETLEEILKSEAAYGAAYNSGDPIAVMYANAGVGVILGEYQRQGYFVGNGCPAVFYNSETGESPVKLVNNWLLKPYMPKSSAAGTQSKGSK